MTIIGTKWVLDALVFATKAHAGQERKYTGEPYIVHPIAVAHTIATLPSSTSDMISAALLHDTIEDCDVTYDDLSHKFGPDVADMVNDLTDRESGNRSERKAAACKRLGNACANSQTIKVADLIDNTKSIVAEDRKFAKVYLKEKLALLLVLTEADPDLRNIAFEQLARAQQELMED